MLVSPEKLIDSRFFGQKGLDSLAYYGSLTTFGHYLLLHCSHCLKGLSTTERQGMLHRARKCFF